MARKKRPVPKSQRRISEDQHEPYEVEGMRGGINTNPNNEDFDPDNRGNHTTLRGDNTKPFSISLMDIDEAVHYYLEHIIKPSVLQNGERLEVPILYGSAERWKQVQRDGVLRDRGNKLMLPVILFKRTSIEPNRSLTNKLDANFPKNYNIFTKSYSSKNKYDNFNVLTNRKPEKEYHAVVVPDYVTLNYEFIISTHYVEQMNKIIEAINYASDSYWGDPERFKFKAVLDSFVNSIELPVDGQRIVKTTFSIKLHGYIVPEALQKDLSSIKKFSNKTKLVFDLETTDWDEALSAITNPKSFPTNTIFPGKSFGNNVIDIYLNSSLFVSDVSDDQYIVIVNTEDTPQGSKVGNDWEIADETIQIVDDNDTVIDTIENPAQKPLNIELSSYCPAAVVSNLYYNRAYLIQTTSYDTGDEAYRRINGGNDYNDLITTNDRIQYISPDLVNDRMDYLKFNNEFGHKFRFTGKDGGYFDESDSTYRLSNGTLSTLEGAFPTSPESAFRFLIIDHLTGFVMGNERDGATLDWGDSLNTVVGFDFFGEGIGWTWFIPSWSEMAHTLSSSNGVYTTAIRLNPSRRPFFTWSQPSYWTGTTRVDSTTTGIYWNDTTGGRPLTLGKTSATYQMQWSVYYNGTITE